MILNIQDNGMILKEALGIQLNDFTVITGANGSGKTQLLHYINNQTIFNLYNSNTGEAKVDELENPLFVLVDEAGTPLTHVVYTYPGVKQEENNQQDRGQSLMKTIINQWEELRFIPVTYRLLTNHSFDTENLEVAELNSALAQFIKSSMMVNTMPITPKHIQLEQIQLIKKVAQQANKPEAEIELIDFIIFYPIPQSLFSSAIDLLFHQFHLKRIFYPRLTENISTPWDSFNSILDTARFQYQADYSRESDSVEVLYPVKLRDRTSGKLIDFASLSSGETTIMNLIFVLYNSDNGGAFPQVILFDEPDAHLHPSLTQDFLNVITSVLVERHQVKVILTTHSPSTVALTPDESIYAMDRNLGRPVKESKRTAISTLSSGLVSLTIEESRLGIIYNIKEADKPILFTEGITDKIVLEQAWTKLYGIQIKMPFFIQDCFDASFLANLFSRGADAPDGIFHQFPNLKHIALFDFDATGYASWNRDQKKFNILLEENPRKCLTRFNRTNGYKLLLPVPDILEISQFVIESGNKTYEDKSILTIESLLFNVPQLKDFFTKQAQPGGSFSYKVNDAKKRDFASAVKELDPNCFSGFIPLFEKIKEIIAAPPII